MNEFFKTILDLLQFLIKPYPMSIDRLALIGFLSSDAMIPQHLLLIIKHVHHFFEDVVIQDQLVSIIQVVFFAKRRTNVFRICVDISELGDWNAVLLMQLIDEMSIVRRVFILHDLLAHIMRVLALV